MTEFGRNVTNCTLLTFTVEEVNCLFLDCGLQIVK